MEAEAASTSKFQIQRMASMSSMSESDISPAGDENIEDEIKEEITSDDGKYKTISLLKIFQSIES